jgi:prepilin-type N-terminal cleavage/methylation domain-containing protein
MEDGFHASRIMFHISRTTPYPSGTPHSAFLNPHCQRAFTMVEIAISLAIIGFAMVAIIGVLPIGMTVQKDNREETIINQDATVFMNAIRNGAWGLDDLTNYVTMITKDVTFYPAGASKGTPNPSAWFNYTNSSLGPQFSLTNGYRIIGLLSTPKYIFSTGKPAGVLSNHVVAYVRSMSGTASEKPPPNPRSISDLSSSLSFSYRLTSEVIPYWTNYFDPSWVASSNYSMVASTLQSNLHDLRLIFAWPFTPQGVLPKSARGQSFRTLVSGQLVQTNDFGSPLNLLYFFQPRTYVN